jgi:hypothetical protein
MVLRSLFSALKLWFSLSHGLDSPDKTNASFVDLNRE